MSSRADLYTEISIALLVLTGLYFISIHNYVLFHSLAELFSIVIAAGLFMVAWNIRRILENQYLLFIGIAYLFIGILDTIHTIVYPGMVIVGGLDTNPPTQLWIAARYMESLSLLFAPLFFDKRLRAEWVFFSYAVITFLIFSTIFYFHIFPDCYIQGIGLTPFKVASEFVISGILLGALLFLVIRREEFDANVLKLLILSILATMTSELSFTIYVNVYELSNLIGHYLKILSFYLIYKAVIQTGLTRPFNLLFRNLHAKEERYRGLVELSPDAIFVNRSNKIDFVNPAALQLFGATAPEQILGRSPLDLFHSDYHSIMQDRIQKMLNGQPVKLIEEKIIRMDGTVRDVEVAASPFHDQEGTAIQVILRDVTDRKRMEETLRKAKDELEERVKERTYELYAESLYARSLIEASMDPLVTISIDGKITDVNHASEEVTGVSREQLIGSDFSDYFTEPEKARAGYEEVFRQGFVRDYPLELTHRDGHVTPVLYNASVYRDETGRNMGVFAAARDITERRRAEAALRRLASELVMAEERERKRIAGVLHDDIAQILASVRMRLDMLQGIPSEQKDKTLQEAKTLLVQSLQETRALMNDLGNPLLFDMGLNSACEALANRLMERHPVRIRCDVRDAFKNLNPDVKAILYQVIRELLNNVVKHSNARNAHVVIDMENGHFRLKVADDGVGFDPQTLGAPTVEGGFGLYSIRERLIAVDGSLRIESTPGTGTVVTVILPQT